MWACDCHVRLRPVAARDPRGYPWGWSSSGGGQPFPVLSLCQALGPSPGLGQCLIPWEAKHTGQLAGERGWPSVLITALAMPWPSPEVGTETVQGAQLPSVPPVHASLHLYMHPSVSAARWPCACVPHPHTPRAPVFMGNL